MTYERKVCQHCGEGFGFDSNDFDGALDAFKARKEHLRVCPVGHGWEQPSEKWQKTLKEYNDKIKNCETSIEELTEMLKTETIHLDLRSDARKVIDMKAKEVIAHKRCIGQDEEEFEALLEANLW